MSDIPTVQPADSPDDYRRRAVTHYYYPATPSGFHTFWNWLVRTVLVVSLLLNFVLLLILLPSGDYDKLVERYHSGASTSLSKVAIVRVDGLIVEGFTGFSSRQIRDAAQDDGVKAVVLSINSPGGSVTASDLLWKQIKDLRDGKWERQSAKKPVVVSMQSVAASGGYYIAAPADVIFAQPTTMTGSIGVYAPFLDLTRVPEKWGIDMRTITKGELKGASMFRAMSPEEKRHWDDLLEHTYQRFMTVVKDGRGQRLKHDLREPLPAPDDKKLPNGQPFIRRIADGGIFTAEEAKRHGLVDEIGYLDEAIERAKQLANIPHARVVTYARPRSLSDALLGIEARQPEPAVELDSLPGATARLWFLAPGFDFTGLQLPTRLLK